MPFYEPAESQFRVNGDRAGNQYVTSSAALDNGGFVIVWITGSGGAAVVKAQLHDASGAPVGQELLVTSAGAINNTNAATVTGLPGGGFAIGWETSDTSQDGSGTAIKGQVYDASGQASGAQFLVNSVAAGNQSGAAITALANGSILVSWTTSQPAPGGTLSEVKARLFDAAGTALGGEFLVNTSVTGSQYGSGLAAAPGGGFMATWTSGPGAADIYGQIFDASGSRLGGEFLVNTTTAGSQLESSVTALADGRYVVVWRTTPATGFVQTISGQLFDAAGVKIGSEFLISNPAGNPQLGSPAVEALPDGGFVATWSAPGGTDASTAVWAQVYDAGGAASGAAFIVNSAPLLFEGESRTLVTAAGDIVVAWTSTQDFYNYDVAARIVALNAAPVIQSEGGGATAAFTVAEDQLVVTRVLATDRVGPGPVTYAIAGGADAALFAIDAATGHLTFIAAPDAEAPGDADLDNVYEVVVSASDGELADSQALSVTVATTGRGPIIVSPAAVTVGENGLLAATVAATDANATYAITGGADASKFAIDAATGVLSFVAAPNFEAPGDVGADNVYDVEVTASAAGQSVAQALAVGVRNVNEGAAFVTPASFIAFENSLAAGNIAAVDAEGDPLSYSIVGGADSGKFSINALTGALSFYNAPNFEAPGDAGANGVYDVIIRASDGEIATLQAFAITIGNVNEGAVITSNGGGATAAITLDENQAAVTIVTARDNPVGTSITYSISGGLDASRFTINAQTGALNFVSAPNYEAPNDVGQNRVYDVIVRASDGTVADTQALAITITNVNEPFSITSNGGGDNAAFSLAENSGGFTVTTDEQDAGNLTFSIIGGADAARFQVGAVIGKNGGINFVASPNFEAPADANGDNVYNLIVQVSDGTFTDTQSIAITITITNVNEAPVIGSNGAGSTASISLAENQVAVTNVAAADPENAAIVYSISGGVDAAKFTINATTGALAFVTAPNFEVRADSGANNVYDVIVRASDGSLVDTQAIAVTITNVNEAPVITSNGGGDSAGVTVNENATVVATISTTDPENTTRTYSIAGGADAARFTINASSGLLSFVTAPNFEAPTDAGANNVYDVVVRASDGTLSDTQSIAVQVANVNEAVVITSNGGGATAAVSLAENDAAVLLATAVDPENAAIAWSISGGADAARFVINSATGALSFVAAPNFEAPEDAGANNVYDVIVRASDGATSDTQAIAVTITNANEAPVITSGGGGASANLAIDENANLVATISATDPENTARTYSIAGGADGALFAIDPVTGALSFLAAPDFEAPGDVGADNVYEVVVRASDGALFDTQAIAIQVADADEPLAITSNGGAETAAILVSENETDVLTMTAVDPEGAAPAWTIAGGVDAAFFAIDPETGALSFIQAPDFEAPADADGDNVYEFLVSASDGVFFDTQTLSITVEDAEEGFAMMAGEGRGFFAEGAFAAGDQPGIYNSAGIAAANSLCGGIVSELPPPQFWI